MSLRLTINDHHDCCVISNAVREHCRKVGDDCHRAGTAAAGRGDEEAARRFFGMQNQVGICERRTLDRLESIRRRFEDMMDDPGPSPADYSGNPCPGDVAARDSY